MKTNKFVVGDIVEVINNGAGNNNTNLEIGHKGKITRVGAPSSSHIGQFWYYIEGANNGIIGKNLKLVIKIIDWERELG